MNIDFTGSKLHKHNYRKYSTLMVDLFDVFNYNQFKLDNFCKHRRLYERYTLILNPEVVRNHFDEDVRKLRKRNFILAFENGRKRYFQINKEIPVTEFQRVKKELLLENLKY